MNVCENLPKVYLFTLVKFLSMIRLLHFFPSFIYYYFFFSFWGVGGWVVGWVGSNFCIPDSFNFIFPTLFKPENPQWDTTDAEIKATLR